MAVAFVTTNTAGGYGYGSSPRTSASFTPTAGDTLLEFTLGEVNSAPTVTRATGETFAQVGSLYTDGVGDFVNWEVGTAVALSAGVTINRATDTFMFGTSLEYSGVSTTTSGGITTGQTGTTATGSAQSVPSGAVLVAMCFCYTASGLGAFTANGGGTIRDATNGHPGNTSTSYAVGEWAGSGGNITPSFALPSSGQTYAVLQIVLAPASGTVALTGQAATSQAGTVSPATVVALIGQSLTSAAGTMVPNVTVALTGQASTFTAGTVVPSTTVGLTGQSATFAAGTVSTGADVTLALTGQGATFAAGVLAPAIDTALTGQAAAFAAGTVQPPGDVTVALTGIQAVFTGGTISAQVSGADTHDGLPKRRRYDDTARTQVIRESQLKPKKPRLPTQKEPPSAPKRKFDFTRDDEDLALLIETEEQEHLQLIEQAVDLIRRLH